MKLFVPGRICLFGEHTDWAGSYRRINANLEKGYTLIAGTNQGIHAEAKPHATKLIYRGCLNDGTRTDQYEVPMERDALMEEAQRGGFYSYVTGVAYQVLTHYRVRGLEIDNYRTDLPVKKGLSSSAAVCVLIARAFNRIYDLKMTVRGEMEYAYLGEITTPSRCGRMDQGCAYGNRAVMMVFDGEQTDVTELNVGRDLYFVIVDLCASKDTREILTKLNHSYPFAENDLQKGVQEYLGPISARITRQAVEALRLGDAAHLGRLMQEAQAEFDKHLQPACPSQLTSPVLHKVLSYGPIAGLVLGGKGVGSQGDGTAQFITASEEAQEKVIRIIERDLHMPCLKLTLHSGRRVRKAIIPAAGFSARHFPASKALKKELFPIIDKNGRAKPVILALVEEALSAGVEEVCIVVQQSDRRIFEEFFCMPPPIENFNKLSREDQKYSEYLQDLGHRLTFVTQERQEGFGHAVYCAREWAGNEPFMLMLGDHLYASNIDASCARQVLDTYDEVRHSVVGLKTTLEENIHRYGCVTGTWRTPDSVLSVTEFAEKPDLDYARSHLHVDRLPDDTYLTVFGVYVLKPEIFPYLEEHITHNIRQRGEFQLTPCLDRLRREDGFSGCVVDGTRFDIGTPQEYRTAVVDFMKY
ncbi:MAG: NTP transferase domain-containing protein [Chitinivibrionales bacterium]|nr:NTP transferase domain-containing protein [Chitinivibrionales bacterium]MBD3394065.1 NTP transferase domain-containing protein [Chitinivibrionales bacterium]